MEIVLPYVKVNGALLRYISIDLNKLMKYRDKGNSPDSSAYNWCIPNIYKPWIGYSNYIGKGKYYERFDGLIKSKSRAINHDKDSLYDAIWQVNPDNCVCNIVVGVTDEEARAIEALLLFLDERDSMKCGNYRWSGEPLLNKRKEDVDMYLINKYFDLDGNNYIETFRRKMYHY